MTSYVAIPNGDIDQDSPVTQPLMTALRDNPIAIAEGDVTAPKIVGAAMFAPSAGTVVQRNCLPFGNEVLSGVGVSDKLAVSAFTALVACTVQFRVTCTISTATLVIRKNGTAVQTYTSSQTGATTNITLAAGDNVGVTLTAGSAGGGGTSGSITISVLEIRVDTRSAVMT